MMILPLLVIGVLQCLVYRKILHNVFQIVMIDTVYYLLMIERLVYSVCLNIMLEMEFVTME